MTQGITNKKELGKYLGNCKDECISGGVKMVQRNLQKHEDSTLHIREC